jgi:hypothetical protein
MKRNTYLLLTAIAILIACHRSPSEKYKPGYTMVEQSKIISDTAYYSIDLQYPSFAATNKAANSALETLNKRLETFLDTATRYYWGTDTNGAREVIDETGTQGKFELMNRYEVLRKDEDFISIKFETYSYALGAHGFTGINTFNFDVKTGEFLRITDFINLRITENQDILNTLLQKYFDNPKQCFDKEPSTGMGFEKFGVTHENLIFYYEAYELGAYYCGTATIKIPITALKEAGIWKWEETGGETKPF